MTQLRMVSKVHWGLCTPPGPLLRRGGPLGCPQRVPQKGFLSSPPWCGFLGQTLGQVGREFNSSQVLQQGLQPEGKTKQWPTLHHHVLDGGSLLHPERGMMGVSLKIASGRKSPLAGWRKWCVSCDARVPRLVAAGFASFPLWAFRRHPGRRIVLLVAPTPPFLS